MPTKKPESGTTRTRKTKKIDLRVKHHHTDEEILAALQLAGGVKAHAARTLGLPVQTYKDRLAAVDAEAEGAPNPDSIRRAVRRLNVQYGSDTATIDGVSDRIETPEQAMADCGFDPLIWKVVGAEIGYYDQGMKLKTWEVDDKGRKRTVEEAPHKQQLKRIRVKLQRRITESSEQAIERLLQRIEDKSPKAPLIKLPKRTKVRRAYEICIMDPHYNQIIHEREGDSYQTPDFMGRLIRTVNHELLEIGTATGPYEVIVAPIGNDLFHTDSVFNATTKGTPQPEAEALIPCVESGEEVIIDCIDDMLNYAPRVELFVIPGNHARLVEHLFGRIINAYYHHNPNVIVHADASPYKFWGYGCNLVGWDHGHSPKAIRLGPLMANEVPELWLASKYGWREWHLGDQHRKGSMSPMAMEEQGVSIEFIPGLTVPNAWHRINSFNWQKRAAQSYVWDYHTGLVHRHQVNVDRYRNILMGKEDL